jgi:tetratricopeptide (TPR) repeat protein
MSAHQKVIDIFISYHQKDEALLRKLEKHLSVLRKQGLISTWHQGQIVPGTHQDEVIHEQLLQASIILLLVSADFLDSNYYNLIEAENARERHKLDEVRIVPIIIRPCDWENSSLAHLAILPDKGKPLTLWPNQDAAFFNIIAGIRRVIADLTQPSQLKPPTSQSQIWNVPYLRNSHFTGREELLTQLEQNFSLVGQGDSVIIRRAALTQTQAIKGLGGIGKTQIAIEYAYRSRDLGRYTHTLWVNAASEEALITSFAALSELLPEFPVKNEADQQKLVEAVKYWLEQCEHPWLLIFDNVDSDGSLSQLANYFPQQGKGSILFTTRSHMVGSLVVSSITVGEMDRWEGTLLLLHRAQLFEHASIEDASDEEVDKVNAARGIVDALESLPLALDQAGAYIEETGCSFGDYLQLYQDHRKDLLARRGHQTTNYPDAVATTWSLSFQKIEQANPAAAELLRLCAFLAPDRIPEELIRDGLVYWSPQLGYAVADLFAFNQMIEELLKFSLVQRLVETRMFSIHRLVQAVQRDTMEPVVQRQWAERIVRALDEVFPDHPDNTATWPQFRRYLDQVQACSGLISEYALLLIEAADLLNRASLYLHRQALYAIAVDIGKQALVIYEKLLEPQHISIANCLNSLGIVYQGQGDYTQAASLFQRALQIYEQQRNPSDPEYLLLCDNLASLYSDQGNYQFAEALFRHILTVSERIKGKLHLDTANVCNNLATLLIEQDPQDQRRYREAERLLRRCLVIYERQLEPQPLSRAKVLNNLGLLYLNQRQYKKAEPLLKNSRMIYEQELGPQHPTVLDTRRNLARLSAYQNDPQQAQLLLQDILAIQEQTLGSAHPDVAISLNDIALLCEGQGDNTQARMLYQRSLAICQQRFDADYHLTKKNERGLARLQNC